MSGLHTHLFSVKFRGEDHDVEFVAGDRGDWWFYGLSLKEQETLNITLEEELNIIEQLEEKYREFCDSFFDD